MRPALLILCTAALAACTGSQPAGKTAVLGKAAADDAQAFSAYVNSLCDEITGGDTRVQFSADTTCVNCASQDDAKAVDGTDATFSTLTFAPLTQGPITYRATAPTGVVYPAGSNAGVTFSAPQYTQFINVYVRTYLGGIQQETDCVQNAYFNEQDRNVIGLTTTQPFDALEVSLLRGELRLVSTGCGTEILSASNSYEAALPRDIRVHEFCHEFRFPDEGKSARLTP